MFAVGDRVLARHLAGEHYYKGTVVAVTPVRKGRMLYSVDYDDGDKESRMEACMIEHQRAKREKSRVRTSVPGDNKQWRDRRRESGFHGVYWAKR